MQILESKNNFYTEHVKLSKFQQFFNCEGIRIQSRIIRKMASLKFSRRDGARTGSATVADLQTYWAGKQATPKMAKIINCYPDTESI